MLLIAKTVSDFKATSIAERTESAQNYSPKTPGSLEVNAYWNCREIRTVGQRRYDMNGIFHMQGGKNWFLPK